VVVAARLGGCRRDQPIAQALVVAFVMIVLDEFGDSSPVVVTATFQLFYVFVVLELGSRRIVHWNVTAHPTAGWTAQQFRMLVSDDTTPQFVIHDRDSIYAEGVDATLCP
jgi:hypothetical protein